MSAVVHSRAAWRRVVLPPLLVLGLVPALAGVSSAQTPSVDLKTFITSWYVHGTPYSDARAYGSAALPELIAMLHDPSMETHWVKVVYTIGCIGDPAGVQPLMDFLQSQRGEISADAFRATLGVLPAIGSIAYSGDPTALKIINDFVDPGACSTYGVTFSYGHYHDTALSEVMGRMTIAALGFSGRPAALDRLNQMFADHSLRPDWVDNVAEAININTRVVSLGPARAYAGGQ
jgi:hypothetical protein